MATHSVRFHVPEPCSEKWKQMLPTERGAFCASCSKNLYDFTQMTDAQITDVIRNSNEKVCGRFRNDQLVPPQQLSAVTISAQSNAPQLKQFLYVLWMVFGLSLFSCTPENDDRINSSPEIALAEKQAEHTDTLAVKAHTVTCAPVVTSAPVQEYSVVEIVSKFDEIIKPEMYTTTGIPFDIRYPVSDSVVTFAEQPAHFPGGNKALRRYLTKNIRYPEMAREARIRGTVYVEFTVQTNGNISNARILQGIGYGCDEEALRAINNMQGWQPAVTGGRTVPMVMRLPIRFHLRQARWFVNDLLKTPNRL